MMKDRRIIKSTIRYNTFETNSSSEHSVSLSNKDDILSLLKDAVYLIESYDSTCICLYEALGKLDMAKYYLIKDEIKENILC